MSLSPAAERRCGSERRSGGDRRLRSQGFSLGTATGRVARDREPVPLGRLLPHARFNETEAAQRTAAIAAHQRELSARLGRNVGLSVAALDYLLNISGDLIAPTIVEHEILEVLEHRSVTDPLTGLFNRYHFEATLKREAARCLRHRSPLSLLLLDVDGLKAVNDRWGHQRGDQMLARVAGAIRDSLRGCDIGSRYGGDEFAVILPDTDARAARLVAERICAKAAAPTRPPPSVSRPTRPARACPPWLSVRIRGDAWRCSSWPGGRATTSRCRTISRSSAPPSPPR